MNLDNIENTLTDLSTLAEIVGVLYKDTSVQVYWGEAGGTTKYSDFDVSNNLFIEGKVLWGKGHVFAIECEIQTPSKMFKKVIILNDYCVYMVTPLDGIDLMTLFKGKVNNIKRNGGQ